MKTAYWKGRPAQMLLSMQRPTSWIAGNFDEIREHHWQWGRMKIYHPHELTTHEAKMHARQCQLPNSYVFKPWFHGHTGYATSEQICMDHLAWIQSTNIYDFQYYAFGERVRNLDMFTGADTLCPLVEINEVMQQAQEMGEFGRIDNSRYLMKASPLIEHIYISAFPPYRQDQIRTATLHEVKNRPEVLWDARRRFPPRFSTEQDEHNVYITICTDSDHDADAAYAQRLQNAIDEKDSVVYSKRKLQLQEDAAYAQSLAAADADNNRKTRANTTQQQMSSVNNRENLQMMLDFVTPLEEIPDNEEDDDDQPMELAQLEQLEEIIHGQPYQPGQYSQANITFHGSEPEGSPAEMHGEDSE